VTTEPSADHATVTVRRRVPRALPWLLGLCALGTVLARTAWPGLAGLVDPAGLRHGEVWRLVTPVLVQPGPWPLVLVVFVLVALVGWPAERWFDSTRLVALCAAGIVGGSIAAAWWQPHDGGLVLAGCGVLGGFAVWWLRMRRSGPVTAGLWVVVIGLFLAVGHQMVGVALLAGGLVGAVVLRDVPAVYRGRVRG
jgi:hypothetical protein